jgi:hypothetical protein
MVIAQTLKVLRVALKSKISTRRRDVVDGGRGHDLA